MDEEEKTGSEVGESEERRILPWYNKDVFHAFNEIWDDFRRDYLRRWRPPRFIGRPWRLPLLRRREVCTDLIDTGREYRVCAEVPGIPKDKVDVIITKDSIEISGKSEAEKVEEDRGFIIKERGYSEIFRKLSFPEEVIPENAEATLKNGILEVRIPKKKPTPEEEKYKVEIK